MAIRCIDLIQCKNSLIHNLHQSSSVCVSECTLISINQVVKNFDYSTSDWKSTNLEWRQVQRPTMLFENVDWLKKQSRFTFQCQWFKISSQQVAVLVSHHVRSQQPNVIRLNCLSDRSPVNHSSLYGFLPHWKLLHEWLSIWSKFSLATLELFYHFPPFFFVVFALYSFAFLSFFRFIPFPVLSESAQVNFEKPFFPLPSSPSSSPLSLPSCLPASNIRKWRVGWVQVDIQKIIRRKNSKHVHQSKMTTGCDFFSSLSLCTFTIIST